jgi:hypothetical protein
LTFDPLQLAEDQKILLVPSGGLYGTAGSADLKARLQAFVEAGGTLIVLAQMLNILIPARLGEVARLYALGWRERIGRMRILTTILVERRIDLIAVALAIIKRFPGKSDPANSPSAHC